MVALGVIVGVLCLIFLGAVLFVWTVGLTGRKRSERRKSQQSKEETK